MSGLFDVSERWLLDQLFGSGTPASYAIGLSSAIPVDAGTLHELSGGGYARVTVLNTVGNFPAATTSLGVTTKTNGNNIVWDVASSDWAQATHWFIYDSVNSRPLLYGALSAPFTASTGSVFQITASTMAIRVD